MIEKRRHPRFRVSGSARFQAATVETPGELLDIGSGGLLIRSGTLPDKGTNLGIRFSVQGYPGEFECSGRVVRSQLDVLAVMFLREPAGLSELLQWLQTREP